MSCQRKLLVEIEQVIGVIRLRVEALGISAAIVGSEEALDFWESFSRVLFVNDDDAAHVVDPALNIEVSECQGESVCEFLVIEVGAIYGARRRVIEHEVMFERKIVVIESEGDFEHGKPFSASKFFDDAGDSGEAITRCG